MEKTYAKKVMSTLIDGKEWGRKQRLRLTATAKIHSLGSQSPSFCITGEVKSGPGIIACGRLDEDIARHFRSLRPYQRWNNCHVDRGPWYYVENALYHAGLSQNLGAPAGECYPANWEHFKSCVVWGAVPETDTGETLVKLMSISIAWSREEVVPLVTEWLQARKDRLMAAFRADMGKLFGSEAIGPVWAVYGPESASQKEEGVAV